jgi:hypothetical protein
VQEVYALVLRMVPAWLLALLSLAAFGQMVWMAWRWPKLTINRFEVLALAMPLLFYFVLYSVIWYGEHSGTLLERGSVVRVQALSRITVLWLVLSLLYVPAVSRDIWPIRFFHR